MKQLPWAESLLLFPLLWGLLQLRASPTLRKINPKPDAVSHVFPTLNFGTTSSRALFLQELILMHW